MGSSVLRPDGTVLDQSGWVRTGGTTKHGVLADDSDATYLTDQAISQTPAIRFSVGTVSLPAGAVSKTATVRVRAKTSAVGYNVSAGLYRGDGSSIVVAFPTLTTSFAEYASAATAVSLSQADVDALQVYLTGPYVPSSGENVQVSEAYVDLVYAEKPTVNITAPTGSPTITDTSQPTITWTYTDGTDGGPQARYEVKIFSAAQYGAGGFDPSTSTATWASGEVIGAGTSQVVGAALPNAVYRAYVRAAQTINGASQWSDWDFEGFTLTVVGPTISTVVALALADGIQVTVNRNTGGVAWDFVDVERSIDAGVTWTWVRSAVRAAVSGDSFVVTDREVPIGVSTLYRGRGIRVVSSLDRVGDWVTATATQWVSSLAWLRNPYNSALDMQVKGRRIARPQRAVRQGVFYPLGAKYPVVVSGRRQASTGQWVFQTRDSTEFSKLKALIEGSPQLLLQAPTSWMVGESGNMYLAPGNFGEEPLVDKVNLALRHWSLDYTEIDRPPNLAA